MEPVQACIALNVISINLNLILTRIGNQCNRRSTGVMWQNRGVLFVINLAAIFWKRWLEAYSFDNKYFLGDRRVSYYS